MAKWVDAGATIDYNNGDKKCLDLSGMPTVVCQVADELYAVSNVCPHAGLPLGEGDMAGKILTCPFHGYTYNVATGQNIDMPDDTPLPTFEVKVEGGRVMVSLPEAENVDE